MGLSSEKEEESFFTDLIKKEFNASKKSYGSTKITATLNQQGHKISRRRVAKIMREHGWRSKYKKKFKITTAVAATDSDHKYPVCRNLLNQNFTVSRLNEVWVSDITTAVAAYIKTDEGWLYLTTIIDLYDRQVIGHRFLWIKQVMVYSFFHIFYFL